MEDELTKKQRRVLKFITRKIWQEKRPPTIREIAQNLRFSSTGTVRDYLRILQTKGYIKITRKRSRAIELTGKESFKIPIVAQVYAGSPVLTYEDIEGYINLEHLLFRDEQIFALKVEGDSMIEARIMPQDLILVRKQSTCQSGDIIVASLNDEITIKRFRQHKNKAYLEPANKNYPIIPIKGNFSVLGKIISVIRNYV